MENKQLQLRFFVWCFEEKQMIQNEICRGTFQEESCLQELSLFLWKIVKY